MKDEQATRPSLGNCRGAVWGTDNVATETLFN